MNMQHRDVSSIPPFRPRSEESWLETTDDTLRLGTNENPLGPSPRAVEAVRRDATRMHRYPSRPHAALDRALADQWNVETEQIWIGAGAVSVIDTLTRAMVEPGEAILRPEPGFSYFGRSNRSHYGTERTYPLHKSDDFALDVDELLATYEGEPIVYLNSPHNPTGATASLEAMEAVVQGTDDETLVVVDEAYGHFTDDPSAVGLMRETDRVAVLRTFSKSHGLAGARIGYGIMPESIAPAYDRVSTPFGVSRMASVAALGALEDDSFLERSVAVARASRSYLHEHIDCRTWASEANFVLVEVGDARSATNRLEDAGLEVRDCTPFGLDDCIRITVGTSEQTRRAVSIVNAVID